MRRVRSELEQQHARILKQDPKWLFNEEEIRRNAKEGDMAFDNTDPVLLTIVSKTGTIPENEQEGLRDYALCRGPDEAFQFAWKAGRGIGTWTMFDVVGVAHRLSSESHGLRAP
jgi:hypothetical protein